MRNVWFATLCTWNVRCRVCKLSTGHPVMGSNPNFKMLQPDCEWFCLKAPQESSAVGHTRASREASLYQWLNLALWKVSSITCFSIGRHGTASGNVLYRGAAFSQHKWDTDYQSAKISFFQVCCCCASSFVLRPLMKERVENMWICAPLFVLHTFSFKTSCRFIFCLKSLKEGCWR